MYDALLFLVKSVDKLRVLVYRAPNKITKKKNEPNIRADKMHDQIWGSKPFSKIDLKAALHHIDMKPNNVWTVAFNTKCRLFEYLVIRMGAFNVLVGSQILMNQVSNECMQFFYASYTYDFITFSNDKQIN